MSRSTVSTAMHLPIGACLKRVRELASPVIRTCHIGNNTSNVWGWLALARNARLVLYDHTLYGIDENCIPWTVLGDGGRVEACYSHTGAPMPGEVGLHVTEHLHRVPRKYSAHLCYGLRARHDGEDLMSHHLSVATRLSQFLNDSRPSFDTLEYVSQGALYGDVIRRLARCGRLDRIFDRWARESKKGYVVLRRLRRIRYLESGDLELEDIDGVRVFRGSLEALLETFFEGMRRVSRRLLTGKFDGCINYPWVTLAFGYLGAAVEERWREPRRRTFWHGAGSASSYYFNDPAMRSSLQELLDLLIAEGFLPSSFRLRMIPTFGCQVFAISPDSLTLLEELLAIWQSCLRRHRVTVAAAVEELASTTQPFEVGRRATDALSPGSRRDLEDRLDAFNRMDPNRLPVAHVVSAPHAHYNKYGMAQRHLLRRRPLFPTQLQGMRWGELELLVKVLAHLKIGQVG